MQAFNSLLSSFSAPAYALLRIMSGLMFVAHGTQKLFSFPSEFPYGALTPMTTAAAYIELIAGLLIAFGLLTRPAAFIASGMSAVGYWVAHGLNDFYPINNHGELIALYCFVFLFIATHGSGILSVDSAMKRD